MSDIIYRENIWEKLVWVMSIVNTFYEWTIFTGKLDLPHNSTRGQIIIIYFFQIMVSANSRLPFNHGGIKY